MTLELALYRGDSEVSWPGYTRIQTQPSDWSLPIQPDDGRSVYRENRRELSWPLATKTVLVDSIVAVLEDGSRHVIELTEQLMLAGGMTTPYLEPGQIRVDEDVFERAGWPAVISTPVSERIYERAAVTINVVLGLAVGAAIAWLLAGCAGTMDRAAAKVADARNAYYAQCAGRPDDLECAVRRNTLNCYVDAYNDLIEEYAP